ncbi:MAG: AraC family transcriptional regulator [Pseudomonadales bacterium]|nr:AraC family transcriptional regulator [Pseudomonadales bacterium]
MFNSVLLYAMELTAILSALLLGLGYLKAGPDKPAGRIFALGALFGILYLFEGMGRVNVDPFFRIDISPWPWRLLVHPAVQAVPGLFMAYCFHVFQEGRRFPPALTLLLCLQVALEAIVLLPEGGIDLPIPNPLRIGLDIMQLFFVSLALFWTLKGWSDDLVQERRLLRWLSVSLQGLMVFIVLVIENLLVANGVIDMEQARLLTVSTITCVLTAILLASMKIDRFAPGEPISQLAVGTEKTESGRLSRLTNDDFEKLFHYPRLHRESGLTISSLAARLNLPEYRLRKFIRNSLGYPNFSSMLHRYRIDDACELLADPASLDIPILKIAMTVGYQSATPFNVAFRELKGETPSEFRRRALSIPNRS